MPLLEVSGPSQKERTKTTPLLHSGVQFVTGDSKIKGSDLNKLPFLLNCRKKGSDLLQEPTNGK